MEAKEAMYSTAEGTTRVANLPGTWRLGKGEIFWLGDQVTS